jgi:hypothetical protein
MGATGAGGVKTSKPRVAPTAPSAPFAQSSKFPLKNSERK